MDTSRLGKILLFSLLLSALLILFLRDTPVSPPKKTLFHEDGQVNETAPPPRLTLPLDPTLPQHSCGRSTCIEILHEGRLYTLKIPKDLLEDYERHVTPGGLFEITCTSYDGSVCTLEHLYQIIPLTPDEEVMGG